MNSAASSSEEESGTSECPVCQKLFLLETIEAHVNRCLFLNTNSTESTSLLSSASPLASGSTVPSSSLISQPIPPPIQQSPSSSFSSVRNQYKRSYSLFESQKSPKDIKRSKVSNKQTTNKLNDEQIVDLSSGDEDVVKEISKLPYKKKLLQNVNNIFQSPVASTSIAASSSSQQSVPKTNNNFIEQSVPLAEKMRPTSIVDYVGQDHILAKNTILRTVLDKNEVPSMILWGPPGCGKTTLAHIIANNCKTTQNTRFVKLSATMVGVNDVKEIIKVAKNEQKFQRKTILFMDEIHRFNKLQQDTFLPHVESGAITLIGATTENPSFSLNSALLSRCRVIVFEKLNAECMFKILCRSLQAFDAITYNEVNKKEKKNNSDFGGNENNDDDDDDDNDFIPKLTAPNLDDLDFIPKVTVERESLKWLAEMCDGDARIALNSLQLAMQSVLGSTAAANGNGCLKHITLEAIKDGIKRSHFLYDRKGDQHYDMISALHKSIRASDDNAALYWSTRIMLGGEDPRYICRRMIRAASEDIGLADPNALSIAVDTLNAVQLIGMPEADCIISQCAVYLARAPKSGETYLALGRCKQDIEQCKGPQPSVPLHLRNAPTRLMKQLGYGEGYNLQHKDRSGLTYMPQGLENKNYF